MQIHELSPMPGSTHVDKRKGRGHATGNGKTAGRGHKGQKARSGGGVRIGFEGGQMPLARRLPKRSFYNHFAKEYTIINISDLNGLENGTEVTGELLKERGIIGKLEKDGLKVLGKGELTKQLTVKAAKFSKSAEEAIKNAGGNVEVI